MISSYKLSHYHHIVVADKGSIIIRKSGWSPVKVNDSASEHLNFTNVAGTRFTSSNVGTLMEPWEKDGIIWFFVKIGAIRSNWVAGFRNADETNCML